MVKKPTTLSYFQGISLMETQIRRTFDLCATWTQINTNVYYNQLKIVYCKI